MINIVCNTTPILTLLKISKFDLLEKIFSKIIIPYGVYEEIEEGKEKKYYVDLKKTEWIEIIKIHDDRTLLFDLDKGEAETIILAKEINADLVIMDEKMGRKFAKFYDLNIIGTIGILMEAKKRNIITDLKNILLEMKNKGIYLNSKFIDDILKKLI